jgi:hypothetical protein
MMIEILSLNFLKTRQKDSTTGEKITNGPLTLNFFGILIFSVLNFNFFKLNLVFYLNMYIFHCLHLPNYFLSLTEIDE